MRPIHFLLAMLVPASWGLGLTVGKAGLGEMPPLLLMSFRFGVTALALVWFVRMPRGALLRLCGISVLGCTLQYGLTFTGMKYLDVATTTLIIHLEVPFGVIAAALMLKERSAGAAPWASRSRSAGLSSCMARPAFRTIRYPR